MKQIHTPCNTINTTIIRFPEISLALRDAQKLRGYFGNLFRDKSPLLHNHLESGEVLYRYPMVQYKVLHNIPTLVGINEGADLLVELFLKMKTLVIDNRSYPIFARNIERKQCLMGLSEDLHGYHFETLWMALNQQNHIDYLKEDEAQRPQHLKSILIGNIISFCKAIGYQVEGNILANIKVVGEKMVLFKNKEMLAFKANLVTNMLLPDGVGLGRQTSRGFGTIFKD